MTRTLKTIWKKKDWAIRGAAVLACVATGLWAQPANNSFPEIQGDPPFVATEVLVQYRDRVSNSAAAMRSQAMGRGRHRALSHSPRGKGPMHLVELFPGADVQRTIQSIERSPDVEYAQPNYIYHTLTSPNDTQYGQLWGLHNSAQTISSPVYATNNPGTSGNDIDAETAWDTITDCSTVTVAVIDSGVNYNHEDLNGNMATGSYTCPGGTGTYGCDFVGTGDADPQDLNGHGTHVAGTIGAVGNNSTGSTGVCWDAKILAVRALNSAGSGTTADIIEAVNFAVGTGSGEGQAKIINMSLGGVGPFDGAYSSAIDNALANGVVVVVAAGNSNQNHNSYSAGTGAYPCDFSQSNLICVAAVDQSFARASFSDYDTNAIAANRKVDLGAPGTNVYSAYFGTETTIADDFNAAGSIDWTQSGTQWDYVSCGGTDMLLAPTTRCTNGTPGNSVSATVYKEFDLSSYSGATVSADFYWTLRGSDDSWTAYHRAAGGNPSSGTTDISLNGSLFVSWYALSFDISDCAGSSNCSIGYRYATGSTSNAAGDGVAIRNFLITGKTVTTDAYRLQNGTSMAAPHVAGVAALIWARNPNFTYSDVITAVTETGTLAAGISTNTRTGRVVNAAESLTYIPQAEGVSLSVP